MQFSLNKNYAVTNKYIFEKKNYSANTFRKLVKTLYWSKTYTQADADSMLTVFEKSIILVVTINVAQS